MTDTLLYVLVAAALLQMLAALFILRAVRTLQGGGAAPGSLAAERVAALKLAEQARVVYAKVITLPPTLLGPGGDRKLREAELWTPAEVAALKPETPVLAATCGEAFIAAEAGLKWLHDQATGIRAKPKDQATHYVDFPHEKWKESYEQALDGLHLLETYGEVTAKVAERR
jgi:hypothetical protein